MSVEQTQEVLLSAVTAVSNAVASRLQMDQTVKAIVQKCVDATTREYLVSYNGGIMRAYVDNDAVSYAPNTLVYMFVPSGDYSERKTIVGKVNPREDDKSNFVTSLLYNYNVIGDDVITVIGEESEFGLSTFENGTRELVLYNYSSEEGDPEDLLAIDSEVLKEYLREAGSLKISCSVRTEIPLEQRMDQNCNINYGLYARLAIVDGDDHNTFNYKLYKLDTYDMIGNPLLLPNYTEQYQLYDFSDIEFDHIEKIWIECYVNQADETTYPGDGDNIFFKDISVRGLKPASKNEDGYKLSLSFPQGAYFKRSEIPAQEDTASLQAVANLLYYKETDLSDAANWYWFIKDSSVDQSSELYNAAAGNGWRLINNDSGNVLMTMKKDNYAYKNEYKVVVDYKDEVRLTDEFVIFNESNSSTMEITSSAGTEFNFSAGWTTLEAKIFKESGEELESYDGYSFYWNATDATGIKAVFVKRDSDDESAESEYDEAVAKLEGLKKELTDFMASSSTSGLSSQTIQDTIIAYNNAIQEAIHDVKNLEGQIKASEVTNYRYDDESGRIISYQLKGMRDFAYVECTAMKEGNNYGTASIMLTNKHIVDKGSYYIEIDNADQVFKYDVAGVSPTHEKWGPDAQEIKPLVAHLYGPGGVELTIQSVSWESPAIDSLISSIAKNAENPTECSFTIADTYSIQKTNNQIACVIKYNGTEFRQLTNFLFIKNGEGGTNGTDLVCRISVADEQAGFLPYIYKNSSSGDYYWHLGENEESPLNKKSLKLTAYRASEKIYQSGQEGNPENISVKWGIAGTKPRNKMTVDKNGTIGFTSNETGECFIVKSTTQVNGAYVYTYYPVPIAEYTDTAADYKVKFLTSSTLRFVTYESDGHNPSYGKDFGIWLDSPPFDWTVTWEAMGGDIKVGSNETSGVGTKSKSKDKERYPHVSVIPNDTYTGSATDNRVVCKLYKEEKTNANLAATITVPICMLLNRHGLASLNQWDGNSVSISEEEGYILAPQIGAGTKDDNENTFTGIVMGTREKTDGETDVGLFGYSNGQQSIFLDAADGSAHFGLANNNDPALNGRIEFYPSTVTEKDSEKISHIGNWHIGKKSLYNVIRRQLEEDKVDSEGNKTYKAIKLPAFKQEDMLPYGYMSSSKKKYGVYLGKKDKVSGLGEYQTLYPKGDIAIQGGSEGIIFNSDPAYLSVKSRPFGVNENGYLDTSVDKNIQWDSANTVINPGDSFEVEIDPNKSSVFTIYRHKFIIDNEDEIDQTTAMRSNFFPAALTHVYSDTPQNVLISEEGETEKYETVGQGVVATYTDRDGNRKTGTGHWKRQPFVGINAVGEFYTNAVENNGTAMSVGAIGAFGKDESTYAYSGAKYAIEGGAINLIKFFIATPSKDDSATAQRSSTLHISGGSMRRSEYPREIHLHAKALYGYISAVTSEEETTPDYYKLDSTGFSTVYKGTPSIVAGANILLHTAKTNLEMDSDNNGNIYLTADQSKASLFLRGGSTGMVELSSSKSAWIGSRAININASSTINMSANSSTNIETAGTSLAIDSNGMNLTLGSNTRPQLTISKTYNNNTSTTTLKENRFNIEYDKYTIPDPDAETPTELRRRFTVTNEDASNSGIWIKGGITLRSYAGALNFRGYGTATFAAYSDLKKVNDSPLTSENSTHLDISGIAGTFVLESSRGLISTTTDNNRIGLVDLEDSSLSSVVNVDGVRISPALQSVGTLRIGASHTTIGNQEKYYPSIIADRGVRINKGSLVLYNNADSGENPESVIFKSKRGNMVVENGSIVVDVANWGKTIIDGRDILLQSGNVYIGVDPNRVRVLTENDLNGYATQNWVQGQGYATQSWVQGQSYIAASDVASAPVVVNGVGGNVQGMLESLWNYCDNLNSRIPD